MSDTIVDRVMNGISSCILDTNYDPTNLASYIVLIPVVAEVFHFVQLGRIQMPQSSSEISAYCDRADPINKAHALGALARSVIWITLLLFTKISLFAGCAVISLVHLLASAKRMGSPSYEEDLSRPGSFRYIGGSFC